MNNREAPNKAKMIPINKIAPASSDNWLKAKSAIYENKIRDIQCDFNLNLIKNAVIPFGTR